ncbi:hypothetical protein [Vallitalea okinawensis]|uniref:hypothetical protein n=1 Tax=Vallitalea okinawensis TaxID=2078660 RepID=UPI000CFB3324|nr:hypothetical protein [Vallitalea okinawensis]
MGRNKALSKLSFRELVLIVVLFTVLLMYLSYTYIVTPVMEKHDQAKSQFEIARTKSVHVKEDIEKKDAYDEEKNNLIDEIKVFTKQFPDSIDQEKILLDLISDEEECKVVISNYSFNTLELFPIADYQPIQSLDGENKSEKSATTNTLDVDLSKYPNAYVLEYGVSLSLNGDFQEVYDFIEAIENHEEHIKVNTVSMVSSERRINCSLNLTYIGFLNGDQANVINNSLKNTGDRESIFAQTDFKGSAPTENSYNKYNPDFSLLINTYLENGPKFSLSKSGDNSSEVYVDGNKVVEANILISEGADRYTYTYGFGETTYMGEFSEIRSKDEIIYINVVSKKRVDQNDQTGVLLTLNNDTNHLVQLTIISDDENSPRFRLVESSGRVIVKK